MSKKRAPPTKKLTKKQLSRRRREEQQLRWIWISVGIILALIVVIIAVGLISQSTQTVAMVNGEPIKVTDYQKRVRYYYYSLGPSLFENEQGGQSTEVHQQIVDVLIEEALVRQEAAKRNIVSTDQEIQLELEQKWFQHYRDPPTPTPSPTVDPAATATPEGTPPPPTPTPDTEEAFQARYEEFVNNVLGPARLKENYLRDLATVSVLRAKLQEEIVSDVPTEEEQVHFRYTSATDAEAAAQQIAEYQAGVRTEVHARHILVETREEAEAVLARLQAGEDFAALAAELSTDTSNKDDGGDLGWFPRGTMVSAFDAVVFENPVGLYPEPVESEFGYHVVEILDREERPIDLEEELFDVGWYGRAGMAEQFGALFAEMVFQADIGLFPEPVPTTYGPAIVQVLEKEVRTLDETEREQRRQQQFQQWIDEIQTEGDVENQWDPSMIPTRL